MLMKLAPASVARALASSVLPVPGGPKSNMPLHGWRRKKNSDNQKDPSLEEKKTMGENRIPARDCHG